VHSHPLAKRGDSLRESAPSFRAQAANPVRQRFTCRIEEARDLVIGKTRCQRERRESRTMQDFIRVGVADAVEKARVGERSLYSVILAPQLRGELVAICDKYVDPAAVHLFDNRDPLHHMQGRAALGPRLCQIQRPMVELECCLRQLAGDLLAGFAPAQPAGNHQMHDEVQIAIDTEHDSLAHARNCANGSLLHSAQRRIHRSQHERIDRACALDRVTHDETLERFQVHSHVWQLRHRGECKFRPDVMRNLEPLPIDGVLPQLVAELRRGTSAVLVAPPGAGKTTRVPLALLDESWLAGGKIVMLEPRRLAARAAANHMAHLLGERVGETVGYRVRMDSRIGPRTRIEVVTEGVLTRMLADDPFFEHIRLVVFDEFHERSLHADVGLALTLHTRDLVRSDLRVLVMSATLDASAVARLLDEAPVIASEGRAYPVETRYVPPRTAHAREATVVALIERALHEDVGDVLVFLPGAAEIRRVAGVLSERALPAGSYVVPLYGAMPLDEQDRAIRPSSAGSRKVVLATSIAQTSLTIEGVRVVIDSGLARVPRYAVRTGMTRLETVNVSRAAADQRRGRAGRIAPGVCYRAWDAAEDASLKEHDTPEILEADLTSLALDLAVAGVRDPKQLRWLDPPPPAALARAHELLQGLGAIDSSGAATAHGRSISTLGMHPRLAHMVTQAHSAGFAGLACDLAALVEERDVMRGHPAERDPDVRTRIEALHGRHVLAATIDRAAIQRVRDAANRWRERLGVERGPGGLDAAGAVLAFAYPDRIAQRRSGAAPRYVLRNGVGAILPPSTALHNESFLVAAELDGRRPESLVLLAAPLTLAEIEQHFGDQIERRDLVSWDAGAAAVVARRVRKLGALVLSDDPLPNPDAHLVQEALVAAIVDSGYQLLSWTKEATALRDRLAFLHAHDASWPDVSTEGLTAAIDRWLVPYLAGVRRRSEIGRIPVAEALLQLPTWQQRAKLDDLAPTHFLTPSGVRARIDYGNPTAPVLAVKLQEMFGLTTTPRVLGGRVPLTLHLLSPSHRPVQVTQDLESFWKTGYAEVRKELRARYPKHKWPDSP